ncbi:MAG TPA: adenine phosphoribosyltransferase [Chryseosolibacter sp.]
MSITDKFKSAIRDVKDFPKPGIIFKDITPIFNDPKLVNEIIGELVRNTKPLQPDAIAAVEARGFIFGSLLAHALECKFVPIRKAGKLPYHARREEYSLEYGTAAIEMHEDAIAPGSRVIVHDDLLATGGTAEAAGRLIRGAGGVLAGFTFLINLSFLAGSENLKAGFGVSPYYLVEY